jgi:hypothetical protein
MRLASVPTATTFLVTVGPNGHNRGLIQDDTALAHVNKGVGSAQVDGKIAGKHATQFLEHGKGTLGNAWVKSAANSNNDRDFGQGANMLNWPFFRARQHNRGRKTVEMRYVPQSNTGQIRSCFPWRSHGA